MENSKIEWTDHTFNPWVGCQKVSEGCRNCYAERLMDGRFGRGAWGPQGTRQRTSAQMWRQPLLWNARRWAQCEDCGWRGDEREVVREQMCPRCGGISLRETRQRVFCASLADVFEDRPELKPWREDLFELMERTTNLTWMILTKRPELAAVVGAWYEQNPHVWVGTSVEHQAAARLRLPHLEIVRAAVRFVSCEPLIGPVDLSGYEWLDLVIVGGESGPQARPMSSRWAREVRDFCQVNRIPFFFKQWGEWAPVSQFGAEARFAHRPVMVDGEMMARVGRGMAGHRLDGRLWRETPEVRDGD